MSEHSEQGTPFVPADDEARRHVIETLDRPLVVEAGAGTGKTTLLIARLLHALEVGAVRMSEIVAISFTEKAAAELRLRLRQELERRSADASTADAVRARLQAARHDLARAQISTIHAFASSILHERPVEARLDPQFRMLDELESLQLQRSFWQRWLDDELQNDTTAELLKPVLLAGVQLEPDLQQLARALYDNRDIAEVLRLPAVPHDLEERMQAFRRALQTCVRHAETHCRDAQDKGFVHLRDLERQLAALDDLPTASWPSVLLGNVRIHAKAGRREAWRPGTVEQSKAMRQQLADALEELHRQIARSVLRRGLIWLRRYLEAYEAEKHRLGVLDFQDLLLHARRLVRDDLAVRRDLGQRIGMLCVDEFQDTDPLQAELVLFLAEADGRASHWQDVVVDRKLFLVGDPKQSIYRFRRADLDVYARCCEIVRQSGGEIVDIVQNFRSRPTILHWVNGVFTQLFARPASDATSEPRYAALVPPPETQAQPAVWIVRERADENAPAHDGWRQREARALARFIKQAIEARWPVRAGTTMRPVRTGDMAILFARTSGIEHYEDALRGASIPFRQEGGKLFFQRQEVRDVLHALAACDDPHDELAIVAALRSPLFGATDEELWSHRQHVGDLRYTSDPGGSRLTQAFEVLCELHARRHERGVAGTISRLLQLTRARAVYAAQLHGSRAQANFDTLIRQARAFESARPVGLRDFVRSLRDLDEESPRLAEWSPEEDNLDQVRLLTVHMAKGLEFPFVILANLSARGNPHRNALVFDRITDRAEIRLHASEVDARLTTPGYEAVAQLEKSRAEAEERRLLYVAATRARDYLVLSDFCGARADGYLKTLRETPGALGDGPCGVLPEPASPSPATALAMGTAAASSPAASAATTSSATTSSTSAASGPGGMWCVVEVDARPLTARPVAVRAHAGDVDETLRRRHLWSNEHTSRLQGASSIARLVRLRGATLPGVVPEANLRRTADTDRVGLVTHAALSALTPGMSREAVARMARGVAAARHALDVAAQVTAFVLVAHASEVEARASRAQRVWRGVRWTTRVEDHLQETLLDVVLEEAGGYVVIDYSVEAPSKSVVERARQAQRMRARLLENAGRPVVAAGTFFLQGPTYVPLEEWSPTDGA